MVATPSLLEPEQLRSLEIAQQDSFHLRGAALGHLLDAGGLRPALQEKLSAITADNPDSLMLACFTTRSLLTRTPMPDDLVAELHQAYEQLGARSGQEDVLVGIRPWGAKEHDGGYLRGLPALLKAVAVQFSEAFSRLVMHQGYRCLDAILAAMPSLKVGRALGWCASGLLLSGEPRFQTEHLVAIYAQWGLAEDIARKELARDEELIHKPTLREGFPSLVRHRTGHQEFRLDYDLIAGRMRHAEVSAERTRQRILTDQEALRLGRLGLALEAAHGGPVEADWGMEEGWSRELHLLACRPLQLEPPLPYRYVRLRSHGPVIAQGVAVGHGAVVGRVRRIDQPQDLQNVQPGEVLLTPRTEPDWEPIFCQAAALVTELDTKVSHSTILARQLGLPALLQTEGQHRTLENGRWVTVACCQGPVGYLYDGPAELEVLEYDSQRRPTLPARLTVSLAMPEQAWSEARRPWDGVGLLRSEFLLSGWVRLHPMAVCQPERLPPETLGTLRRLCREYDSPKDYLLDQWGQGLAMIAAAFWPRPVKLRLSDLKSHEYAKLVGGEAFELREAMPALGFRGAARYTHPRYRPAFLLELEAIARVRHQMGFHNLHLTIPFCRTPREAADVLELLKDAGLVSGQDGLQITMMAELPSNVVLAEEFLELFDGLAIGSNDLTQLTLGCDREQGALSHLYDERHPALLQSYQRLLEAAQRHGKTVSFCGEVAGNHPDFARWLVERGVHEICVAPDAYHRTMSGLDPASAEIS